MFNVDSTREERIEKSAHESAPWRLMLCVAVRLVDLKGMYCEYAGVAHERSFQG